MTELNIDGIARVCHEANRAYCLMTNDPGLPNWEGLEESYRESTRTGVRAAMEGKTHKQMHDSWMQERRGQGWQYGPVLDRAAKIHPNLIPYADLPEAQKRKDALFSNIVRAITATV